MINNYDALRDTTIRVGFKHIFDEVTLKFFPQHGNISRHTISLQSFTVFNPDNSFNDWDKTLDYRLEYKNNSIVGLSLEQETLDLLFPTSFTDKTPLPAQRYSYLQYTAMYNSDTRKQFSYGAAVTNGGFYNGNLLTLTGSITYRSRPHFNLIIETEYDKLNFPSPYGSSELFLISPKVEINFSTVLSWTTFLQYNTQQNNFNINSRFQYRFKPMSDIYLVYTDNYFTTPLLQNKNRALVFKFNYWLNM